MHPTVARVVGVLTAAGWTGEVRELSESAHTAAEAAAALGCDLGAIASSLVFGSASGCVLVVNSGAHRVSEKALAEARGVAAVGRASPREVREATGYAIGGVAPVGHPGALPTFVDPCLAGYERVWAAAGHPHAVFATTFDELVALTGGRPACLRAERAVNQPGT